MPDHTTRASDESSTSLAAYVTIADAAKVIAVDPKSIRRMIARGEVEARRFGPRLIRVSLASLEKAGRPLQHMGGDA